VVFCGTFDTKGTEIKTGDGKLAVLRQGEVKKLVRAVEQITFSGTEALRRGQQAIYVTERAVFRLTPDGILLEEIAPGVDLRRDVLERMDFAPLLPRDPAIMPSECFSA